MTHSHDADVLLRCPHCEAMEGRFLPEISRDAHGAYYRCDGCAHVWFIPKHSMAKVTAIPKVDRRQQKRDS